MKQRIIDTVIRHLDIGGDLFLFIKAFSVTVDGEKLFVSFFLERHPNPEEEELIEELETEIDADVWQTFSLVECNWATLERAKADGIDYVLR